MEAPSTLCLFLCVCVCVCVCVRACALMLRLCVRVSAGGARLKGNFGVVGVDFDATPKEKHVCEREQRARAILVLHQDGQLVTCRRGQGRV